MSDLPQGIRGVAPAELVEARLNEVRALAFHQFLGVRIEVLAPGQGRVVLPAGSPAANPMGVVHGGILYALLDVSCFVAALPLLDAQHNAATADLHCAVLRPAPCDQDIIFDASILRAGRSLLFGESSARANGKLVARATVTKSVVPHQAATRR